MFSVIPLLVAGASLAAAGGVNKSIPTPAASRTFKQDATQATDAAVTGTAAVYGINDNENTNGGLGCQAYVRLYI